MTKATAAANDERGRGDTLDRDSADPLLSVQPATIRIVSGGLALAAVVATALLHDATLRQLVPSPDPILFIGPLHAVLFLTTAALAMRTPRVSALLVTIGTVTGPWSAILQNLQDPFHPAFLFLTLVGIVTAALLLTWRAVIAIGTVNLVGIIILAVVSPSSNGSHLIAGILNALFTALFTPARMAWEQDQYRLATSRTELVLTAKNARESEERFRLLSDAAREAIIIHTGGFIRLCNPRMPAMFGIPMQEIVGRDVLGFIDASDQMAMRNALETERRTPLRIMCRRRNGTRFPAEARSHPITYHGEDSGVLTLRDLTDELDAEHQRRRIAAQEAKMADMEQTIASKVRLMNLTGHELKNPLTPIRLQVAIMRNRLDKIGDETDQRNLDILERATERLGELVNDVLDVGRLEDGSLQIDRQEMDLTQVILDEMDVFRPVAEGKSISIQVTTEPLQVLGDPRRLAQVMSNLLGNALRFAEHSIHITARSDGKEAVVEVADDGVGIDPERKKELFQPFVQVHDPSLNVGGTGLGLYICKGIMDAHEGSIDLLSDGLGEGTRAVVRLPLEPT